MRKLTGIACAAVLLTACSAKAEAPTPGAVAATASASSTSAPKPVAASSTPADPYAVYLANAPKGEPKLSRDDASTRALLGCGKAWPPGTVDAVLQKAYAAYC